MVVGGRRGVSSCGMVQQRWRRRLGGWEGGFTNTAPAYHLSNLQESTGGTRGEKTETQAGNHTGERCAQRRLQDNKTRRPARGRGHRHGYATPCTPHSFPLYVTTTCRIRLPPTHPVAAVQPTTPAPVVSVGRADHRESTAFGSLTDRTSRSRRPLARSSNWMRSPPPSPATAGGWGSGAPSVSSTPAEGGYSDDGGAAYPLTNGGPWPSGGAP